MSDLNAHTVVELKAMLKEEGLEVSGRKADLIERLQAHQKKASTPATTTTTPAVIAPTATTTTATTTAAAAPSNTTKIDNKRKIDEVVAVDYGDEIVSNDGSSAPTKRAAVGSGTNDTPTTTTTKAAQNNTTTTSATTTTTANANNNNNDNNNNNNATPSVASTGAIVVAGFVRPLTLPKVREFLAQYGEVVEFSMNDVKSTAFVTYASAGEATKACASIQGMRWPDHNKGTLTATPALPSAKEMLKPRPSVDVLFRKTQSKPQIYWQVKNPSSSRIAAVSN